MSQSNYNATNDTQGVVEASTDLSSNLFSIVKEGSTGVVLCGAGERPVGVLVNNPKAGAIAKIIGVGPGAKVICSGVITKGDLVATAASGQAVSRSNQNWVIGFAKESGVLNDIIEIDVHIFYIA